MKKQPDPLTVGEVVKGGILIFVSLLLITALGVGGCAGLNSFKRSQKRADAVNRTAIVKQGIKTAQQQALVTAANDAHVKALADQRLIEARGIRAAQDEISKTLTGPYLQHEAIQAQERTAASGRNNTIIYVPSGNNGVPLVQTPPLKPASQLGGGQ